MARAVAIEIETKAEAQALLAILNAGMHALGQQGEGKLDQAAPVLAKVGRFINEARDHRLID